MQLHGFAPYYKENGCITVIDKDGAIPYTGLDVGGDHYLFRTEALAGMMDSSVEADMHIIVKYDSATKTATGALVPEDFIVEKVLAHARERILSSAQAER